MFLKSKVNDFTPKSAFLIEPEIKGRDDDALYAEVHQHGHAVIQPLEAGDIEGAPVTLLPADFEREWRGD